MNADGFGRALLGWATEDIPLGYNRRLRGIGLHVFSNIVLGTPVDKGTARANWDIEIDGFSGFADPSLEGSPGSAASASLGRGRAVLDALQGTRIPRFIGISNNLPYVRRLNEEPGFTKKSKTRWVEAAIADGQERVARAL